METLEDPLFCLIIMTFIHHSGLRWGDKMLPELKADETYY